MSETLLHPTIAAGGVIALLGYVVVFLGLILLMAVVLVLGRIMVANAAKQKASAPAVTTNTTAVKAAAPAPGSAGKLKLYDVPDRDAAMVMAIVANRIGKPLNELRFRSIKEVK